MDRREILAERPVEKGRGFMPGVSVNPSRILVTAGLTGRDAAGNLVPGGMAPTDPSHVRALKGCGRRERGCDDAVKNSCLRDGHRRYNADRPCRAARSSSAAHDSASTGLVVRRWPIPPCSSRSSWSSISRAHPKARLLEKFNAESHPGDSTGRHRQRGRLLYWPARSPTTRGRWRGSATAAPGREGLRDTRHSLRRRRRDAASVVKRRRGSSASTRG